MTLRTAVRGNQPIGEIITNNFTTGNADYAEYFEWDDGNTNNEDRIGYFVGLSNDKIIFSPNSSRTIGITSKTSSLCGDAAPTSWDKINLKDNLGRELIGINYSSNVYDILMKENIFDIVIPNDLTESSLENIIEYLRPLVSQEILDKVSLAQPIQSTITNSDYDPTQEYIPRSMRKEWSPVGLLGKIHVYDNGECIVGEKCDCLNGIAVPGTSWYVLQRITPNIIRVLYK